jgi:hypothetical protein
MVSKIKIKILRVSYTYMIGDLFYLDHLEYLRKAKL